MSAKTDHARTGTAYHEAGHAAAAIYFDYITDSDLITIKPEGNALGSVSHLPPLLMEFQNRRQLRSIVEQICIGMYAGMAAEKLFDPDVPEFHGDEDERQAWNLPSEHGVVPRGCQFVGDEIYEAYLLQLKRKAGKFVKKHRTAISVLAAALLAKDTMTAAEAIDILRPYLSKAES